MKKFRFSEIFSVELILNKKMEVRNSVSFLLKD